jgi:hypothetical protein
MPNEIRISDDPSEGQNMSLTGYRNYLSRKWRAHL